MLTEPAEKEIAVRIGGKPDNVVFYYARDTHAPADFDGFGTIEIHRYDDTEPERAAEGKVSIMRTVLIRSEHLNWQTCRYSSGMFASTPTVHDESAIEQELWKRLTGKGEG